MRQVFHDMVVSDSWRDRSRSAGRGLLEVLVGSDPPPVSRPWAGRSGIAAFTTVGTGLVVLAILDVLLVRHAVEPGVGNLVHTRTIAPILLLAGLGILFLAWRFPLLAWRVGYLVTTLSPLSQSHPALEPVELIALVAVACQAGWRHSRSALWWMWALMMLPVWLWVSIGWEQRLIVTSVITAIAVAVDAASASHHARRDLAVQSERTELEEARRTVLEERTRIARELHDVVAHHMSLIAVQAETAPYRLGDLSDSALAEFSSVSGQAREALSDMRKLLGVLRNDSPSERAPQPQLSDIPELVAASRRSGVSVELSMPDQAWQVPSGAGLCAYRIVQEALSNASRHAPGSVVAVTIKGDGRALRLQITNGPGTATVSTLESQGAGHGLVGMHERVALLGGTLSAMPSFDGGFFVSAVLPLDQSLSRQAL